MPYEWLVNSLWAFFGACNAALFTYHKSHFTDSFFFLENVVELQHFNVRAYRLAMVLTTAIPLMGFLNIILSFKDKFDSVRFLKRFGTVD